MSTRAECCVSVRVTKAAEMHVESPGIASTPLSSLGSISIGPSASNERAYFTAALKVTKNRHCSPELPPTQGSSRSSAKNTRWSRNTQHRHEALHLSFGKSIPFLCTAKIPRRRVKIPRQLHRRSRTSVPKTMAIWQYLQSPLVMQTTTRASRREPSCPL